MPDCLAKWGLGSLASSFSPKIPIVVVAASGNKATQSLNALVLPLLARLAWQKSIVSKIMRIRYIILIILIILVILYY